MPAPLPPSGAAANAGGAGRCGAPQVTRTRAARGFTFVELMYASAFFLFGLTGLLTMDAAATKQIAQAQHQMRATSLAGNTAALCALMPLPTLRAISSAQSLGYDAEGALMSAGGSNAFYVLSVNALSNATGGLDVRVQVDWQEPSTGAARRVTLQNAVPIP